jgi:hypothetical protein
MNEVKLCDSEANKLTEKNAFKQSHTVSANWTVLQQLKTGIIHQLQNLE